METTADRIVTALTRLLELCEYRWAGNPDPEIAARNKDWNDRLDAARAALRLAEPTP